MGKYDNIYTFIFLPTFTSVVEAYRLGKYDNHPAQRNNLKIYIVVEAYRLGKYDNTAMEIKRPPIIKL